MKEETKGIISAQPTRQSDQSMQECIQNCADCHRICLQTMTYCLQKGGKHAESKHIRLLLDCAEICRTSANFMIRGSEFHTLTCGVCAELCERCAAACEQMGDDDETRRCAEMCRAHSHVDYALHVRKASMMPLMPLPGRPKMSVFG